MTKRRWPGILVAVENEPRYPPEGLVPYDPNWLARYAELPGFLHRALGDRWLIEHIGSTSVPGLLAKPVTDLALRVAQHEQIRDRLPALADAGWTDLTQLPTHQALFQLDQDGVRRVIGHLFTAQQWPTAPPRLFATWLRAHPGDREAYGRLKRELRHGGLWGHDYSGAKAAFVQHVVEQASTA